MKRLEEKFPGIRRPTSDFGDVRTDLRTTPLYLDIDLSTARSLTAAPQTALILPIAGNVVYIDQKAQSGIATFHFQDDASQGNTPITVFPGFIARMPYTQLVIENVAQPGQVMRLIYGVDIDFVPAVSPGNGIVNVVSGELQRTKAGVGFSAFSFQTAVAANYAQVELVATTRRVVLNQIMVTSTTGTSWSIAANMWNGNLGVFNGHAHNKLAGGADATADLRSDATSPPAGGTYELIQLRHSTVREQITYRPSEPWVLPPGWGVVVYNMNVNADVLCNWEFFEEDV